MRIVMGVSTDTYYYATVYGHVKSSHCEQLLLPSLFESVTGENKGKMSRRQQLSCQSLRYLILDASD